MTCIVNDNFMTSIFTILPYFRKMPDSDRKHPSKLFSKLPRFLSFIVFFSVCVLAKETDIFNCLETIASWQKSILEEKPSVCTIKNYVNEKMCFYSHSFLLDRVSCLLKDEVLLIERITNQPDDETRPERAKIMKNEYGAKNLLFIEALRDGLREYYYIKTYYEHKESGICPSLYEKYVHCILPEHATQYLQDMNFVYNEHLGLKKTSGANNSKIITEKQLHFVVDSYNKLVEKKEADARKTEEERKKGLVIIGVEINEEAYKDATTLEPIHMGISINAS